MGAGHNIGECEDGVDLATAKLAVPEAILGALCAVVTPVVHAGFAALAANIDKSFIDEKLAISRRAPLSHVINPRGMIKQPFVRFPNLIKTVDLGLLVPMNPTSPFIGVHRCVRVKGFIQNLDFFFADGFAQDDVALQVEKVVFYLGGFWHGNLQVRAAKIPAHFCNNGGF
jgi:hypothetical protein